MKGKPHFVVGRPGRKYVPRRRHGVKGFPQLVMILAAATFLGVYGYFTPETVGDVASPVGSFASPTNDVLDEAYYLNCAAARAAGAAPLYAGEPGYRSKLDRDNDGVACEPYRGR